MAEVGTAFVSLLPSARGFGPATEKQISGEMDSSGKSVGSKFGAALKLGAVAAVGGAVLAGNFLKGAFEEAEEAAKIGRITEQIIKSTGGAANVTADQVADLSQSLSEKAGVDDELIQKGANLLLTFKNVANAGEGQAAIFDRATTSAIDLSAAGFGSVEAGAKMLGKALNDPVAGITALSRAGVTFTADQKAMIEGMVEAGNVLGAQKLILKEVESQVGGVAAASATAGEKLAVTWGNLKETIGENLAPFVNKALSGVQAVLSDFAKGDFAKAFSKIGAGLLAGLRTARDAAVKFITGTLAPAIARGVGNIREKWRSGWANFWKDPDRALDVTEGSVRSHMRTIGQITGLGGARSVARFAAAFGKLPGWGAKIAAQTTGDIYVSIGRLPKLLASAGVRAAGGLINGLGKMPGQAVQLATETANRVLNAFQALPGQMMGLGADIVYGLAAGIRNAASSAISAAVDVASSALRAAKSALGSNSPSKEFMKLGADSGAGLVIGLRGSQGAVSKAGADLASGALHRYKAAPLDFGVTGGRTGASGGRVAMTITNWDEGTGYFEVIADSRVDGASAMAGQRARAL